MNYTEHEKALYNLTEQSTYTVYGNSTDTNYGITFSDGVISTAGQSKVKINGYTNIKDFHADFTVTRESGLLMGGIGFHLQDTAFEKPLSALQDIRCTQDANPAVLMRNFGFVITERLRNTKKLKSEALRDFLTPQTAECV